MLAIQLRAKSVLCYSDHLNIVTLVWQSLPTLILFPLCSSYVVPVTYHELHILIYICFRQACHHGATSVHLDNTLVFLKSTNASFAFLSLHMSSVSRTCETFPSSSCGISSSSPRPAHGFTSNFASILIGLVPHRLWLHERFIIL